MDISILPILRISPTGGAVHAPEPITGVHLSSLMRFNSRSQVLSSNPALFDGERLLIRGTVQRSFFRSFERCPALIQLR
jgi:hypothetical protein